jgi:hypothetical protein
MKIQLKNKEIKKKSVSTTENALGYYFHWTVNPRPPPGEGTQNTK